MTHTTPPFTVQHNARTHEYSVVDMRPNRVRVYSYSHEDDANNVARLFTIEAEEQRQRDRDETPPPRPVIVRSDNIKPHFEEQPEAWKDTGPPGLIIIDGANPEHWQRYVWSYVTTSPADRAVMTFHADVPERQFGYEIGYYPIDVESWEMVPDGPFCADCVSPHEYDNPIQEAAAQYPQAYRAEMIDSPDEDDNGTPLPRFCVGCQAMLYELDAD